MQKLYKRDAVYDADFHLLAYFRPLRSHSANFQKQRPREIRLEREAFIFPCRLRLAQGIAHFSSNFSPFNLCICSFVSYEGDSMNRFEGDRTTADALVSTRSETRRQRVTS